MGPSKILLLDTVPRAVLSHELCKVFGDCQEIQFRHARLNSTEELTATDKLKVELRKLARLFKGEGQDITILTLPSNLLPQASNFIPALLKIVATQPLIVATESGRPEELFSLLELGVTDFITPPVDRSNILPRLWRVVKQARRNDTVEYRMKEKFGLRQLVGESPAFSLIIERLPAIARCEAIVLISGETGTGKEMCARALHHLSPRADHPFIPVNCGAIPTDLIENELFGHERGAFTDAIQTQRGLISEADGGTLFLDEIDSLPLLSQVKLLRFLQEREYRALGSGKIQRADVRVIAASNINLEEAVQLGKLRRDLYYRLNVIPLHLPPLRERRADIPVLAAHFLAKYAAAFTRPPLSLSPEALEKLKRHDWPGNVRELEHIIERAVALAGQPQLQSSDFILAGEQPCACHESLKNAKAKCVANFERAYIQELLLAHQGNISKAAKAAQKNRRAFWQLIRKYGIDVQKFKTTAHKEP